MLSVLSMRWGCSYLSPPPQIKGYKEIFGSDGYVYYLDCGHGNVLL